MQVRVVKLPQRQYTWGRVRFKPGPTYWYVKVAYWLIQWEF